MQIGFIMDPLEAVRPEKDTSYFLMLAAYERGHRVFHIAAEEISYLEGHVMARCVETQVSNNPDRPFEPEDKRPKNLADLDVIFVRTDPPFDRRYFYTTLLLDLLPAKTQVVNAARALRDWNEKISALFYPDLTAKTLVTSKVEEVQKFLEVEEKIVLKPIDGHGGRGIEILERERKNVREVIEKSTHQERHQIIVQKFVAEADQGDKRILLVDGEPIGGILRIAGQPGQLNNLDQGGKAVPADLTENDLKICEAMKPRLQSEGLFFVGIDLLGDTLTEVNVTSPTGIQELVRFSGIPHHHHVIEKLETKTS